MEKQMLEPTALLELAAQHAYCAEHLLQENATLLTEHKTPIDTLFPITSLLASAFELTFKAFLLHTHGQIHPYKNLIDLMQANHKIGLTGQEIRQIQQLSRSQSFRKGILYDQWESRQALHKFCIEILTLFSNLQEMIPLELQPDYLR